MTPVQVIGEVGGSSSRWAVVHGPDQVDLFPAKGEAVPGFNPLNGDATLFAEGISTYLMERSPGAFRSPEVLVYGAGCGSADRKARMASALAGIWPNARIHVETDLLGAARGLLGTEQGLVLILGTGMNAGHFDGRQLFRPMPSLGWVLGDEGSGADIGRTLLQDAFYQRMPQAVSEALFGADGPDLDLVLQEVHRSPFPARALAARTALLAPLLHETYVIDLVRSRFHAMAELLVTFFTPEQRASVVATGSVAWGFRELLAECLLDRGMTLTAVERDPLPGLVRYHRASPDR
jgi:N-acetylglucosamine kinase-like BadF-type ATPase